MPPPAWIPHRSIGVLIGACIVAEGLAAVRFGYASFQFRQALLVLLTGWAVAGSGLIGWVRAPASRTGPLLIITGAAWYLGSFTNSEWLGLLYAAVMVQAVLTYPSGRVGDSLTLASVIAAYAVALVPGWGEVLVASVTLVALALRMVVRGSARMRLPRPMVLLGALFAAVLGARAAAPLGGAIDTQTALEIALTLAAVGLTASLVRSATSRETVTDLVVELGSSGGGDLARELAIALADPTLRVGYWLPEQERYVDSAGRTVVVESSEQDRAMTAVERNGRPVAVLLHDRVLSADAALRSAVTRAAELAAANARLQADVQVQVAQVQASRRRLLDAGHEERRELERRLRGGLGPRLAELEAGLSASDLRQAAGDPLLDDAVAQVVEIRRGLIELAEGLHPGVLEERGLGGALADLAARCSVPVDLQVDAGPYGPAATEATVYYVCSEALANVVKHAAASRATVRLIRTGDGLGLEVTDDGIGGVDFGRGTGLRGLRDRVEALGGFLTAESLAGHGTRLVATIPP